MPLTKGFLQSKFTNQIPKYRYFVGVIVGLLMAFFLYALQYMTRELLRVSSIGEDDLWVLNDTEVGFYNLIFAFIAVIVGQSFFLEYFFNRPKNSLKTRPGRLQNIVHEQRFFNWYFLAWFYRSATMYGLMFCTAGLADFYIMSLYPDFRYMFVLMILVLFFQTWNGLLLTFKRKAFRWMLISLFMVSGFSYVLSRVEIVDYKSLNERVINRRLDVKYKLRIPKSAIYTENNYRFRHLPNISIVLPKDSGDNNPLLFKGKRRIDIGKLPEEMLQLKAQQNLELQNLMPTFLRIDKEVPMSYVHEIKRELAFVNLHLLNYLVIPSDALYDERYYMGWNRTFLSRFNTDYFAADYAQYLKWSQEVSNRVEISISKQGYDIDGSLVPEKELVTLLKKRFTEDLDYTIILNFKENVDFGTYFTIISKVNEAIYALRDEAAFKDYGMDFKTLEEEYRYGGEAIKENIRAIQTKYPVKYVENWDESGIRLRKKAQPDFALPEMK